MGDKKASPCVLIDDILDGNRVSNYPPATSFVLLIKSEMGAGGTLCCLAYILNVISLGCMH